MEQLINFIIRPPRAEYDPKSDLLDQEFMLKGKWFQRKDVEVKNSRGDTLQCSHYVPITAPNDKSLPCVIYCHGNSGCRADASEAAIILLPSNITVFAFDFSGSGLSGGEHVSLGWYEKDDLRAVVDYLRADGNVSMIGLWGRSMGAVTSLMYGAEDPSVAGMVLDSPFSDLVNLMMELVDTYKFPLPKFTVKFAIQFMRRAIQKKAKFDIMELNTIKVAKSSFVPVLIGHAIDDDFIRPHHSDRIFEAYVGDKNIIKFEGDHNSPRPQFYFDSINIFFHNVLQPPEDEAATNYFEPVHDYIDKDSWNALHGVGFAKNKRFSSPSSDSATSNTEDAIHQLRNRRPMSTIVVPADISPKGKQSNEKDEGAENNSSSSRMISFEFSNGQPSGPHVPTSIDDDQYVEYPLEDMGDFPSNVDEEERMFMEAIIESLKDMEMRHPQEEKQSEEAVGDAKTGSPVPAQVHPEATLPAVSCSNESPSTSLNHDPDNQMTSPDASETSGPPPFETPPTSINTESTESTESSSHGDIISANLHNPPDMDIADNTKATLTVEKSPTSHVMDGLMRRWDLNFFRKPSTKWK